MNNLKIYENNCKEEVLSGLQLQKKRSEYIIGKTLFAASDRGKKRPYQEDSVLIMDHPTCENIKLIAVADGVGGHSDGDLASNHVMKEIIKWFEKNSRLNELNTIEIKESLEEVIKLSMWNLQASPYAATTLSLAIIGKSKTIIANIGDSRIYTYTDGVLKQETVDDSAVQEMYNEKLIPDKELMRFHHRSNIITKAVSRSPGYEPNFKLIDSNYDSIIAVSDGVSDCLSTEELQNIIKNSKNLNIAASIVNEALDTNSFLIKEIVNLSPEKRQTVYEIKEIIKEEYFKTIIGGKDNTTAAVYVRKNE